MSVFQWDGVGDILPQTAAAVFNKTYFTAEVQALNVGQIVCFPADDMQYIGQNPANGASQWRKCDGASMLKADYLDLWNVIGYTFGGAGANFTLPDLRGRVIVNAGSGSGLTPRALGDDFGEEMHTLTQGEMPSHSHSIPPTLTFLAVEPGEAPALDPGIIPAATGNTGGDSAHNNMQPSIALFYYIQVTP
jgi:microcystin-dependent protein